MLPLLAAALMSGTFAQGEGVTYKYTSLDGILGPKSIMMLTPMERTTPPKRSPKKFGEPPRSWEFDWNVAGYSAIDGGQQMRFDVWSQESTRGNSRPEAVTRMLMRLYGYNVARLRLQHASEFWGIVSVFLCYGGEPGGEQLFEATEERKLNSIYLYDLRSFTDPLEAAREVAHEYGHATLPPVGGFSEPEGWANGYLGEKLYLPYLAEALRKKELTPDDTLGATAEKLAAWTKTNVDSLLIDAATNGPRATLLAGKGKASMDAFLGLALWTKHLYGERAMIRALAMNGTDPKNFPDSASTAAAEPELVTLNIPAELRGKPFWLPLGEDQKKNRILGAQILTKKDGWVRVKPHTGPVVVRNYRD